MKTNLFRSIPLRFASLLVLISVLAPAAAAEPPAPPRLAVLVYFDQLRGDYLQRWQALFGDDGFRRLARDGAWFSNCHLPYACTVTAAGHASVATGRLPADHGVVGNEWYDRKAGATVSCVAALVRDRYRLVASAENAAVDEITRQGPAPEQLLTPTVADALKDATKGKGKVVALSLKDRSAILPGGRRADGCYWMNPLSGRFVTSTYYRDRLHDWVDAFNKSNAADRWLGKTWDRLRPDLDYEKLSGPDDVEGEGKGVFQGRVFPHPLSTGPLRFKAAYYGALVNSPFGNELLLALAEQAIVSERLGQGDVPDLLTLSFSSNDIIGHCWGPDSQEVLDVTLRSDRIMAELLKFLDDKVGKGKYLLVVTADHGVCPLPEVTKKRGKEAERVSPRILSFDADEFLNEKFADKIAN
jgi:predicted AlkP superfamily pyrophosphatase or phosphodiesterase